PSKTTSDLVDAVLETDELPEWAEFITIQFFDPGASGTVVLPETLPAGRYAFVCFLPAPDETPHAVLGMVSQFNVGAGGGMTPPGTGDAGLANSDGENARIAQGLLLVAG